MATGQPNLPNPPNETVTGRLSNAHICAYALWVLGGASEPQDLEDVTAKCFELAPERFSWRKHSYPNLETAWAAMRHDGKGGEAPLVKGGKRVGWLLTADGIQWVNDNLAMFDVEGEERGHMILRRDQVAALKALEFHPAYLKWSNGEEDVKIYEIADAVQLTADAPKAIVSQRIDELGNMARIARTIDTLRFLEWLQVQLVEAP